MAGRSLPAPLLLKQVAKRFGTPVYVYDLGVLKQSVRDWTEAFGQAPASICYAVKANANPTLLKHIVAMGCDADAVSGGELSLLQRLKVPGDRIISSGVGKTDVEIRQAIKANVRYIAVESLSELSAVSTIARSLKATARVCLRVNPHIAARTHPHVQTALQTSKFGIELALAKRLVSQPMPPHVELVGLSCHLGSQLLDLAPVIAAAKLMKKLAQSAMASGHALGFIGVGGGLGIRYHNESPPSPRDYADALLRVLGGLGLTIVTEPGRSIVGSCGSILARVVRLKAAGKHTLAILDAGMSELIRPALYGAFHSILPVKPRPGAKSSYHVVGPLCESADTFGQPRRLPPLHEGDLVQILDTGAYGFVMASNYNGRAKPPEVLLDKGTMKLIRPRGSYEER